MVGQLRAQLDHATGLRVDLDDRLAKWLAGAAVLLAFTDRDAVAFGLVEQRRERRARDRRQTVDLEVFAEVASLVDRDRVEDDLDLLRHANAVLDLVRRRE